MSDDSNRYQNEDQTDKFSMANMSGARVQFQEEMKGKSLLEKMKATPFVPLGVAGMIGMVGYGAYNYRNRGNMKTSVYLMHLRVKAQAMVVGAITIGMGYSILKDHVFKKDSNNATTENGSKKL